jgi:lactoylglutathione lyase
MKLDGFGIFVKDMETMVAFYKDVLGFEIQWKQGEANVYLIRDNTLFMLYGRDDFEKMTSRKYKYISGLNGHYEIALSVPTFADVDKEFERVVSSGAAPVLEPELEPWGQRTCYIADPEGNLIEIGSFTE